MKIAISTTGITLDAPVESRFGRAPEFIIYDSDFETFHVENNEQNLNAAQGAGIQSARFLCEQKLDCLITGNCGPQAYEALSMAGIAVYTCKDMTVEQAIKKLQLEELDKAYVANVEAHWA